MTEQEWRDSTDPLAMLEALRAHAASGRDRKLRLFGVACCRRIWDWLPGEQCRRAVDVAEQYADGAATEEARRAAAKTASDVVVSASSALDSVAAGAASWSAADDEDVRRGSDDITFNPLVDVAGCVAHLARVATWFATNNSEEEREASADHSRFLRDIFGNPFRPVAVAPSLLTTTVVSLARGIYAENAFDRMPYLADALMDAGCENEEVLAHCKGPNGHVKGCWLIDALLGLT